MGGDEPRVVLGGCRVSKALRGVTRREKVGGKQ